MLALAITISMALPMALKSAMTITTAMAFSAGGAVATPADTGKADSATSDGGKHEPRGRYFRVFSARAFYKYRTL